MVSKSKGVEVATKKNVEIKYDILDSEELQNELRILKDIFKSSYGPTGRLNLIQNVAGGHVTATSNSEKILNGITTVSSPVTRLLLQAVKGHLSNFHDGGLFTGLLTLELIESSLKSPLPRYMAIEINEHSLNLILEYLLSSNCPLKINADIGNMQQMLCVIISILGSKCATGINSSEVEHLAILLLRGFLMCVPTSEMENSSVLLENLRIHGCEGGAINESRLIQGVLLDVRCIPATENFHEDQDENIKVALFDSSLAGNVEDTWFDGAQTELSDAVTDIELEILESMMVMVDKLIKNGVKLLACQKVIHPTLQRYLMKKGLYFIERLSLCHIEAVQQLTGATLLSSFQGEIDLNSFGSLAQIKPMVIHEKRYLHLIPNQTSEFVSTLMLCAPDETALDELKLVCSTALNGLKQLVFDPFLVPGGGCFETNLACLLIQKAQNTHFLQDHGCSKAQYLSGLYSVASTFAHIARSFDHDNYGHLVDMKMHHHWISQSVSSLKCTEHLQNCMCSLVTPDQDTEWCLTEELFCQPMDKFGQRESNRHGLRTEYKNSTLDIMNMKVNGIKTAFETANIILRVKNFVKETV